VNEKTFGIIFGIILAVVIAAITISIFIFYIDYSQPTFICEICRSNCTSEDFLLLRP